MLATNKGVEGGVLDGYPQPTDKAAGAARPSHYQSSLQGPCCASYSHTRLLKRFSFLWHRQRGRERKIEGVSGTPIYFM